MGTKKTIVGWQEWCGFPELGLPRVKAKVDTGARTSALHAYDIQTFEKDGIPYARFDIHPIQRNNAISKTCVAPLVDNRHVRSSSGHKEERPIIMAMLELGEQIWEIEVTLTNRDSMGFRMLLGREAMRGRIMVDPGKSFLLGDYTNKEAKKLYLSENKMMKPAGER